MLNLKYLLGIANHAFCWACSLSSFLPRDPSLLFFSLSNTAQIDRSFEKLPHSPHHLLTKSKSEQINTKHKTQHNTTSINQSIMSMPTESANINSFNNSHSDDNKSVGTQSTASTTDSRSKRFRRSLKKGFMAVVNATVLNTHPSGAPIDGSPRLNGHFAKDCVDATILNKHPASAPIDGRMGGRFSPNRDA